MNVLWVQFSVYIRFCVIHCWCRKQIENKPFKMLIDPVFNVILNNSLNVNLMNHNSEHCKDIPLMIYKWHRKIVLLYKAFLESYKYWLLSCQQHLFIWYVILFEYTLYLIRLFFVRVGCTMNENYMSLDFLHKK